MTSSITSGYGNMVGLPATILSEFRMFILAQVKDAILSARNSEEGTPNQSVGLVFSTDPDGNSIELSVLSIVISQDKMPSGEIDDLANIIVSERLGKRHSNVFESIESFMVTQVSGGTLVAAFATYGVNDLKMSYIDGEGDVLAEGYGVDLFFADQGIVGFVGHADGIVPLTVSSVNLPMNYVQGQPRDFGSEIEQQIRERARDKGNIDIDAGEAPQIDVTLALAKLFDALTAEDDELGI